MNFPRALLSLVALAHTLPAPAAIPQPLAEKWATRIASVSAFADIPSAIATDSHGHVYLAGYIGSARSTLAKLDGKTGAVLWRWESAIALGSDTGPGVTS